MHNKIIKKWSVDLGCLNFVTDFFLSLVNSVTPTFIFDYYLFIKTPYIIHPKGELGMLQGIFQML